jgi:LmbE family N-acetylglucosaminyl deacetylase
MNRGDIVVRQPSPDQLGTVLGVWAHPDDEAYLSAGLMAAARAAGNRVVVVTATLGEQGTADPSQWPPERLAQLRRVELAESLAAIGVHEHVLLGYADGECPAVPEVAAVDRVASIIDSVRPDTIMTFGPDGMTGHPDHQVVSEWTTAAWRRTQRRTGPHARLWYATTTRSFHEQWGELNERTGIWAEFPAPVADEDDLAMVFTCDAEIRDRKFAALRAHRSQTAGLIDLVGADTYRRWWAQEAFADGGSSPPLQPAAHTTGRTAQ